jgi:hypothetical protein
MKKLSAILLAAALVATLAACDPDSGEGDGTTTTRTAGVGENPPPNNVGAGAVNGHTLPFTFQGKSHTIVLGSDIQTVLAGLGHPGEGFVIMTESCAFRGNDYVYRYGGDVEISTFSPNGTDNHVLQVRLLNDNTTTGKGVRVGMSPSEVIARYGQPTEITGTGNRYRYLADGMSLEFLIRDNNDVIEIVYRYEASDDYLYER